MDLASYSRVLCVQPHPDDNDLAVGGFVAELARAGASVTYLTVTDGAAGSRDPAVVGARLARLRRQEQEKACALLGVKHLIWLGHPDSDAGPEADLRREITGCIRDEKPDLVLLPDPWLPYEAHPDHRVVGLAAAAAASLSHLAGIAGGTTSPPHGVRQMGFYWTERPNLEVELPSHLWDLKLSAVRCHASQFSQDAAEAFLMRQHRGEHPPAEHLLILDRDALHVTPFATPPRR